MAVSPDTLELPASISNLMPRSQVHAAKKLWYPTFELIESNPHILDLFIRSTSDAHKAFCAATLMEIYDAAFPNPLIGKPPHELFDSLAIWFGRICKTSPSPFPQLERAIRLRKQYFIDNREAKRSLIKAIGLDWKTKAR